MLPSNPSYIDGDYSTPVRISQAPSEYPFAEYGDLVTEVYSAAYVVDFLAWSPTPRGTVDPERAGFYLYTESRPELTQGRLATFVRTYGNVPPSLTVYGSYPYTKPVFSSQNFNGYWIDNIDPATLANVFGLSTAATSVGRFASGGTFTVTYKTSTTAPLAYNASAATIKAAIDALPDAIADGATATVSGSVATNTLSMAMPFFGLSWNPAGLTPTCVTQVSANSYYAARAAINVQKASHNQLTGNPVRWASADFPTTGGTLATLTVVDMDNFTIPNSSASAPLNPAYVRLFNRTYLPGSARLPSRVINESYLPGVTPGIFTPANIPIAQLTASESAFLLAICQGATWLTVDFEGPGLWRGPIYRTSETQVQVI